MFDVGRSTFDVHNPPVSETRVIYADDEEMKDAVREAAAALRAGEIVGLPTETVYGLAADAFNPAAVARVFAAKERPSFDPLIVHIASRGDLKRVALVPEGAELQPPARLWRHRD